MIRIKNVLCLLLLTTFHFVVGMKKIVKKSSKVVFINNQSEIIPFKGELSAFLKDNKITAVQMPVKKYLDIVEQDKQETKLKFSLPKFLKKEEENSLAPKKTPAWKKQCEFITALTILGGIFCVGVMNYTHR